MTEQILDLDALDGPAGEARGGFPVVLGGEEFRLPAGLPIDVLAPIVNVSPALFGVLRPLLDALADDSDEEKLTETLDSRGKDLIGSLLANPEMPVEVIEAVNEAGRRLFNTPDDAGVWDRFLAKRPTIPQMFMLIKGIGTRYGVGLGEAFRLSGSSTSGGTTSKATSSDTSDSTSEESSFPEPTPAS